MMESSNFYKVAPYNVGRNSNKSVLTNTYLLEFQKFLLHLFMLLKSLMFFEKNQHAEGPLYNFYMFQVL